MNIFVKELPGTLTVKAIIPWIRTTHTVLPLESIYNVGLHDIIIASQSDSSLQEMIPDRNVLIYEDFFEEISLNIFQEFAYNYDYYYLKHSLAEACDSHTETIISGSSYGLFGIDTSMLPPARAVNLSLISQDLYYSLKGIYHVCSNNSNIRNIVLCASYYYFFSDLSKTKNDSEILRVSKVYNPLYKDIHNCMLLPPKQNFLYTSDIFDLQKIIDVYSRGEYQKGYFHKKHPRRELATILWENRQMRWCQLDKKEQTEAAEKRAALHNNSLKRKASLDENIALFQILVDFCNHNKINLLLVVTPVTPLSGAYVSSV